MDQKARRQLSVLRSRVEEGRRGVSELLLTQQVIGLKGTRQIASPQAESHTHPEMLGTLTHDEAGILEEIRLLKRLEAEVVKVVVSVVINDCLNLGRRISIMTQS